MHLVARDPVQALRGQALLLDEAHTLLYEVGHQLRLRQQQVLQGAADTVLGGRPTAPAVLLPLDHLLLQLQLLLLSVTGVNQWGDMCQSMG